MSDEHDSDEPSTSAGQGVVPVRTVYEILADHARERGLQAFGLGSGAVVLCALCHPTQPARLLRRDGVEDDWFSALTWRRRDRRGGEPCEQFVRLRIDHEAGRIDSHLLITVAEALEKISAICCCHDEVEALDFWDWRTDLEIALHQAVAGNGGQWQLLHERVQEAREQAAQVERGQWEVVEAAATLDHRLRVQVAAKVFKELGRAGVRVDQARVSWECGHSDRTGDWARVVVVVDTNGLVISGGERSCPLAHPDAPALRSAQLLAALAARYAEVAAMSPQEQARYRTSRQPKAKAKDTTAIDKPAKPAKPAPLSTEQVVEWLANLTDDSGSPLVPASTGLNTTWKLIKGRPGHPSQSLTHAAQRARQPRES